MDKKAPHSIPRRTLLKGAGAAVAGLGFSSLRNGLWGSMMEEPADTILNWGLRQEGYFPPPEEEGGWRAGDPSSLGVDEDRLRAAMGYHDGNFMTTSYGGALIIIYRGHVIGESYTTGTEGGPQPWTATTCNDMKSSTTNAENIGHESYFDLLKAYYADMTDAILETSGQIYQYVGDEIVVTWPEKEGIYQNNCIQCFAKISEVIEQKRDGYLKQFGLVPEFKAGFHIEEVTTGEFGIIKKDIIYTGDVLNTTARIQAECNTYNTKALISEELLDELQKEDAISFIPIGQLMLRGKTETIQLSSVVFK